MKYKKVSIKSLKRKKIQDDKLGGLRKVLNLGNYKTKFYRVATVKGSGANDTLKTLLPEPWTFDNEQQKNMRGTETASSRKGREALNMIRKGWARC